MKQAVLSHFDTPWIPLTALVIFVVCFAAYALWAYRPGNKSMFEEISRIPLNGPGEKNGN